MFNLAYAMSQSPQGIPQANVPNPITGFIPIIFIFIIFYVLLIKPQQRQQKQHQQMLAKLSKNDDVVTTSGIHGTVVNVDNETVTLRVDDNTRIKFQKVAIAYIKKKEEKND